MGLADSYIAFSHLHFSYTSKICPELSLSSHDLHLDQHGT
jgi:hypothetical protein